MITAFAATVLGLALLSFDIPDISGRWSGDDWGAVVLTKTSGGQYTGTYSETSGKQPGELEVKWSKVERRFNGSWREGQDRFGQISLRLAGDEIRGAFTTDAKSKLNPGTPALADLLWTRADRSTAEVADAPEWQLEIQPAPSQSAQCPSDVVRVPARPTWVPGLEIFTDQPANFVAWSPDGKTLAIGGRRGVRLYDAQSGQPAAPPVPKELVVGTEVSALAFSPDSRLVAVATGVGLVSLFEVQSGNLVAEFHNHSIVHTVAFSPDGALLATGCPRLIATSADGERLEAPVEGTLKLWDAATGELKHDLNGKDGGSVVAIAFSPDGQLLASAGVLNTGSEPPRVKLWNPQTGKAVNAFPIGHGGARLLSLGFSPEGSRLAIGLAEPISPGPEGAIWILDPATGVVDYRLNGMSANQIAFSPDGAFIADLRGPRRLNLWDSSTGEPKHSIEPPARSKGEGWNCFAFSPDGDHVAIGGLVNGKQGVRVWSWETAAERPGEPIAETAGQNEGNLPPSFQFSKIIATPALTIATDKPPKVIAYSPDGKTLATTDTSQTVELFDAQSGQPLAKIRSVSDDEDQLLRVLRGSEHETPLVKMMMLERGHRWGVSALAFSPDSKLLAVGNTIGQVKLFDGRDGSFKFAIGDFLRLAPDNTLDVPQELRERMRFTQRSLVSLAFSPDGGLLVTSGFIAPFGESLCIRLWDARTGEPRPEITGEHNAVGGPVAFSPDGKLLAGAAMWSAGKENISGIKFRNPTTGEVIKAVRLPNPDDEIFSISFSPDSKHVAMGLSAYDKDRDREVEAIQLVQTPGEHEATVRRAKQDLERAKQDLEPFLKLKKNGIVVSPPEFDPVYGAVKEAEARLEYAQKEIAPLSILPILAVPRRTPVAYSPSGNDLIAFFDGASQLTFWKLAGLSPAQAGTIVPPDSSDNEQWGCFAVAPDGNRVAIGGTIDGKPGLRIWDLAEGGALGGAGAIPDVGGQFGGMIGARCPAAWVAGYPVAWGSVARWFPARGSSLTVPRRRRLRRPSRF